MNNKVVASSSSCLLQGYTETMAKQGGPAPDEGIEFLEEIFYDEKGNRVSDPKQAVTGNVTYRLPNGEVVHTRLVNDKFKDEG